VSGRVPWASRIPVPLRHRARRVVRLIQVHIDPDYTAQQLTEDALRTHLDQLERRYQLPPDPGGGDP